MQGCETKLVAIRAGFRQPNSCQLTVKQDNHWELPVFLSFEQIGI
jgi:hypothetical protein